MVAHAPLLAPVIFTTQTDAESLLADDGLAIQAPLPTVKLLDLLTNRYHVAILRDRGHARMELELPRAGHFYVGQRVRFIVADQRPLVSRRAMRTATITHLDVTPGGPGIRMHLHLLAEAAAA
jgi:hypothetical protein